MKKNKTYSVQVKVVLDTDVQISAASLEEAVQKSKEIEMHDVVSFDGEYNDGNVEVTGVFKN